MLVFLTGPAFTPPPPLSFSSCQEDIISERGSWDLYYFLQIRITKAFDRECLRI